MEIEANYKVHQRPRVEVSFYFADFCVFPDVELKISLHQFNIRMALPATG